MSWPCPAFFIFPGIHKIMAILRDDLVAHTQSRKSYVAGRPARDKRPGEIGEQCHWNAICVSMFVESGWLDHVSKLGYGTQPRFPGDRTVSSRHIKVFGEPTHISACSPFW
jgi:hypothetical protein